MRIIANARKEFCIYNTRNKVFVITEVDYINKTEAKVVELEVKRKEDLVTTFKQGNTFCLITTQKNSNEINLITNEKSGGMTFDTIAVELNIPGKHISAAKLMDNPSLIVPHEGDPRD